MSEIDLDLRGLKCPLPALKTRKALSKAAPGALLVVTCTDPMAVIDIPHLVNQTGDALLDRETRVGENGSEVLVFRIRKAAAS
ncbi:sulfurtransferase TusA family protein [Salinarimonas chemoclinalis]|uniref:sulfurtransferase TusA family protein n=1 Tax=Salinarimonas chemoclinalis TaxID=3241599 RepID=UPI003556B2A6